MSSPDQASNNVEIHPQSDEPRPKSAQARLAQIERELQSRVKKKLRGYQLSALKRASLLLLRSEMALLDPASDSLALCRLDNSSRRAVANFERLCGITERKPKQRTHEDVMREAFPQ